MDKKIADPKVEEAFSVYSPAVRKKLMMLRSLIFDVASKTEGVGELEETLKWGQPSYLTKTTKAGSTIRLGREKRPMEITQYISNAKPLWCRLFGSFTRTNFALRAIEQSSFVLRTKFRLAN